MNRDLCDLCSGDGGEVLFRNTKLRVVAVSGAEAAYRGFCRVVWNSHVKELNDLSRDDRNALMEAVFQVESALIASLKPDKMNVASLGNLTPHLHWHIIPRFSGDPAFPKPIWAHTLAPKAESKPAEDATIRADDAIWKDAVRFALQNMKSI
jgi:diadenosine tetraphosphate (Ap4A) HIT family hydrolase